MMITKIIIELTGGDDDDNNDHHNHNFYDQMDDCEVHVPSTLLDWNTMATFFPWGLLLIR